MSKMYTTGEIAKLCDITVRTVQYYDNRGILTPSEISEGGRRLYSQSDFEKLEIICELRKLGLSINVISKIFQEENNAKVIETLLDTHAKQLQSEIDEKQSSLDKINRILKESESFENFNIKNLGDVVNSMEKRKKLKKVYSIMLCLGIVADILDCIMDSQRNLASVCNTYADSIYIGVYSSKDILQKHRIYLSRLSRNFQA